MKKLIVFIFILICIFLTGCDSPMNKKYNAKLYYDINSSFNDVFVKQHITNGSYYENTLYDSDEIPKDYIILVESDEDSINIFNSIPFEIDFEKQNLIIYAYTTNYAGSKVELTEVDFDNNMCNICIKENTGPVGTGSATMPTTRFIVISLDKIEKCNYNFVIK